MKSLGINWLGLTGEVLTLDKIIICIVVTVCLAFTVISAVKKIGGFLHSLYESKAQKDKLNAMTTSDHKAIEELAARHDESIIQIKEALDALTQEMRNGFQEQKKDLDETTVASYRSTIYRLHNEFMAQKEVSQNGLKTFSELVRIYEEHGGNDIVHNKLAPEVLALPISDTDE